MSVSPEGREEINLLMRQRPGRFLLQLVLTWIAIVAAVVGATYAQNVWVTLIVVAFIATRQNILALLLHEQCHRLAFRSKLGDLFCNFAAVYPLFATVEDYRPVHLSHHQNYFTDHDPDYVRKQGEERWTFPNSTEVAHAFCRRFARVEFHESVAQR